MSDIMKESSLTPPAKRCTYESDILDMETERLRFGFGGYIEEIRMMLDASRTPFHFVAERLDTSDEDVVKEHQVQVSYVVQRVLALGVGRALFVFATHLPDVKKALPIEVITLTVKILPLKTLVELDEASVTEDMLEWPQFHNGVAAGLRILPNSDINESWIDFCNPDRLDPHHGGVLLGMGLNGTLKKLPMVSWYRLMTQYSCDSALIGFLLGASAAYRGTKDRKMTKILSVHIPALLPPDSTGFNHSNNLQSACLIGMGLVFMNSSDRFMTCVMLHEIGKDAYSDPSLLDDNFESCALAAGFALGFITLGCGDDSPDLIDLQLRDKLYSLMTDRSVHLRGRDNDPRNEHRQQNDDGRFINVDVTSPGATIALGLMYLKTENQRVANKVDILESQSYMNYVRPDFLLVRVVAKNLIMWCDIEPTDEWIHQQIPDFITADINSGNVRDKEASKQAKYNIQCGAFLCIGLRFAGSKNEQAFQLLIENLDRFMKLWQTQETSIHQEITKKSISTCLDVLCTSAAMVMAGTGRQELASRLKVLYKRLGPKVNYGNNMAVSMALGLLFMGLGGYTFSSHKESIAALLCAFYPFYPTTTDDNRFHLQALRHLWVIAADSRWLMPIDVDKNEPCRVPMYLTMYEDDERKQSQPRKLKQVRIEAPSVLPDYKLIKSICVDSNRYWPLNVDMVPGEYTDSVIKSGLIYIKMQSNTFSYEEDPQGRRLVFALD
ncbi:hypothetical protein K501DRAFT_234486 [Backusella circina FSU 941]|nr:hypothetical protein K501DRAFT_234486 [Backusella circina FSU 941]